MIREATDAVLVALENASVGTRRMGQDEFFLPDDTALVAKALPDTPDRAIAVTVYNTEDPSSPRLTNQVLAVQVRSRGDLSDPHSCDDLADSAKTVLHQAHRVTWNGLAVERMYRIGGGHIGPDESGRQERTDNYRMILQQPGPAEGEQP